MVRLVVLILSGLSLSSRFSKSKKTSFELFLVSNKSSKLGATSESIDCVT